MSYLEINIFGWCLVYIMPIMALAHYLDQHLRIKSIIPYILLISTLFIKINLNAYIHGITPTYWHMIHIFIYNIAILALFLTTASHLAKRFKDNEAI